MLSADGDAVNADVTWVRKGWDDVTNTEPRTAALRRALATCRADMAAELHFLEQWEIDPQPGLGTALRVGQIRRANPALAAEIRAELADAARRRRLARLEMKQV